MCKVSIYEAKTNLSKYLDMLEKGKESEIIIARYDKIVAKLVLAEEKQLPLGLGRKMFGKKRINLDVDNDEIIKEFGL